MAHGTPESARSSDPNSYYRPTTHHQRTSHLEHPVTKQFGLHSIQQRVHRNLRSRAIQSPTIKNHLYHSSQNPSTASRSSGRRGGSTSNCKCEESNTC